MSQRSVLNIALIIARTTDADNSHRQIRWPPLQTTVPLGFVEGLDLDSKRFEWSVKSGNTFELRVINDED